MKFFRNQSGVSLIAAIFIIVILAFMGLVFLALFTATTSTSINELQSTQALYVADGGVEYETLRLSQDLSWYRSTADPPVTTTQNLGLGSFTVYSNLPATMLRTRIPTAASTNPIRVYTTNRFPTSGFLQIEDDIAGGAEFIQYTGISGDTFTGITRNVTIGTITGAAGPHERGDTVYPVTTLVNNMPNNCNDIVSLQIAAHSKFIGAGTIDIEGEEVKYSGSTVSGGNMILTGVRRCQNGTASAAHSSGRPVTPMLLDGASPDFEAEASSTGTVSSAIRAAKKTVQR